MKQRKGRKRKEHEEKEGKMRDANLVRPTDARSNPTLVPPCHPCPLPATKPKKIKISKNDHARQGKTGECNGNGL